MKKTVGQRLLDLKAQSGMPLSEIARLGGYRGASSLQRYFNASFDPTALDYATAQKLGEAMDGAGDPPITPYDLIELTVPQDEDGTIAAPIPVQPDKEMKTWISIYATSLARRQVEAGDRVIEVDAIAIDLEEPVEAFRASPGLSRRGVYGFYMQGISMRPRFYPGEVVFVDERKPPEINDDVLVYMKESSDDTGPQRTIFGRLRDIEDENLVIEHYLGTSFNIPLADVVAVRRVLANYELLQGYAM